MPITGTMDPTAFGALPDVAKADAWIKGDASRLPSDFKGEAAEETAKFIAEHLNLTGWDAARELMRRFPGAKLGIKLGGIGVANLLSEWVIGMSPFDAATKTKFALIGGNVLQGIIAAQIDASDPTKGDREIERAISVAKYVELVDATDPASVKVVLWVDPASRVRMILKAVVEDVLGGAPGAKRYGMISGTTDVPATESRIVEGRYAAFSAAHRKETVKTDGGRDGRGGGTRVIEPPAFNEASLILLTQAQAMTDAVWPATDWPEGKPVTKAAEKAKPWHEQIDAIGTVLFDALCIYPTLTATKTDDVVGGRLGKSAAKMDPAEWNKLAADIQGGAGVYDGCWQTATAADPTAHPPVEAKAEGLTEKGFNLVIARINARVPGADLKAIDKAEIAAHSAWDKVTHAWDHGFSWSSWKLWAGAGLSMAIVVAYALACAWVLSWLWKGWMGAGETPDDYKTQVNYLIAFTVGCILVLVPTYFAEWLKTATQGLLHSEADAHGHTKLANTSRMIQAFLIGLAGILVIVKGVNVWAGYGTVPLMHAMAAMPMLTLAADRLSAKWVGDHEESILHEVVHIALARIKLMNWLGTAVVVVAITLLVFANHLASGTTFQAVIAKDAATGAFYIPTPKGTVFAPEDILGATVAAEQEQGVTDEQVLCLPVGTSFDLPGYTESEVSGSPCAGSEFTVRGNLFGWNWWEREATEYPSVTELYAAQTKEAAEKARLAEAMKPKPAAAPQPALAPKAAAAAPSTYTNATPAATTPTPRGVNCSGLSFSERQKRGC